jgi:hypothetical protein
MVGAQTFTDFYQSKLASQAQWEYAAKGGNYFNHLVFNGLSTNDANYNSTNLNPATYHVFDLKSASAYAIMPNHFRLVLHIDSERAQAWTFDKVIGRWLALHKGPELAQKYKTGEPLTHLVS